MVRTRSSSSVKAGGKAPRKTTVNQSSSASSADGASGAKRSNGSGNPVHVQPTPAWQNKITRFMTEPPVKKVKIETVTSSLAPSSEPENGGPSGILDEMAPESILPRNDNDGPVAIVPIFKPLDKSEGDMGPGFIKVGLAETSDKPKHKDLVLESKEGDISEEDNPVFVGDCKLPSNSADENKADADPDVDTDETSSGQCDEEPHDIEERGGGDGDQTDDEDGNQEGNEADPVGDNDEPNGDNGEPDGDNEEPNGDGDEPDHVGDGQEPVGDEDEPYDAESDHIGDGDH